MSLVHRASLCLLLPEALTLLLLTDRPLQEHRPPPLSSCLQAGLLGMSRSWLLALTQQLTVVSRDHSDTCPRGLPTDTSSPLSRHTAASEWPCLGERNASSGQHSAGYDKRSRESRGYPLLLSATAKRSRVRESCMRISPVFFLEARSKRSVLLLHLRTYIGASPADSQRRSTAKQLE